MHTHKRVPNPQVILELICYVTFAGLMLCLVYTGRYQAYVTPKMVPYFYFTIAVMSIWALACCFRLFEPQHKTRAAHCLVLAIPIILLLLPHSSINTAGLSAGYVNANALTGLPGQTAAQSVAQQDNINCSISGLDVTNQKITVTDDNFSAWLYELYDNMDKYAGYQISIKGFVFRDQTVMMGNEFAIARLMMSCCVADLTPCGFLCQYDKASELKADAWVTVEGTLHKARITFDNQTYDDIQIKVTKITPAQKADGYLYPR